MITKHNLKELIQTISPEHINEAINGKGDYILMECHTFNVGYFATITAIDYNEETETEASNNGNLYCDKDEFLRLCNELEIFEY